MLKPLLQHLLRAAANLPFFVVAFLLFALHVCYSVSCSGKSPLQVCNFTLRRFKVFLLHCCRLCWRRFITCFHYVYYYLLFLIALQRYKDICNQPNKKPKIFVFLTFYNK